MTDDGFQKSGFGTFTSIGFSYTAINIVRLEFEIQEDRFEGAHAKLRMKPRDSILDSCLTRSHATPSKDTWIAKKGNWSPLC